MTLSEPIWARSAMSPSVMPSPRYEPSVLAESWNGRTATAVTAFDAARSARSVRPSTSHQAPAASAPTARAATALRLPPRLLPLAGVATGRVAADAGASSAFTNARMERNRSSGCLAIARRTAASIVTGTLAWTARRAGTGSIECRASTAWGEGPLNGGRPVSIS
jgi:hypothetical protein